MRANYFYFDPKPGMEGFQVLQNHLDELEWFSTSGSIGVLPARLLHMTYPEYLDFCKRKLGAMVEYGNNTKYAAVYFRKNKPTEIFLDKINVEFNWALKARKNLRIKEKSTH